MRPHILERRKAPECSDGAEFACQQSQTQRDVAHSYLERSDESIVITQALLCALKLKNSREMRGSSGGGGMIMKSGGGISSSSSSSMAA